MSIVKRLTHLLTVVLTLIVGATAAEADFTAAKTQFCEVLGFDDQKEFEDVDDVASLGLESTWRARAVLGLALAETGLGKSAAAERCFGWLQHASAPAGLRDQGAFWQMQGLLSSIE